MSSIYKYKPYPKTLNIEEWEEYLKRPLNEDENELFYYYKYEKQTNKQIRNLCQNALDKGLYIPYLTNLDGNCIFQSLKYYDLCENEDEFRKIIGFVMYILQNDDTIFQENKQKISQLFKNVNDIQYVFTKTEVTVIDEDDKEKEIDMLQVYYYDYNMMCQDLVSKNSWTRLPMELILMVMSSILNLEFIIINDKDDYETIICYTDDIQQTVYLGHLGEYHYVPLDLIIDEEDDQYYSYPVYIEMREYFKEWAEEMEEKVNYLNNINVYKKLLDPEEEYQTQLEENKENICIPHSNLIDAKELDDFVFYED